MSHLVQFSVFGTPKGQPRVRAFARGGKASVFDPGTADGWKHLVVLAAASQQPKEPIDEMVAMSIIFLLPRPKRLCTKKASALHLVPCTSKPDLDNAVKAVLDALTQAGWFKDDALVYSVFVEKYYADQGARPGANIRITWGADGSSPRIRTQADRGV